MDYLFPVTFSRASRPKANINPLLSPTFEILSSASHDLMNKPQKPSLVSKPAAEEEAPNLRSSSVPHFVNRSSSPAASFNTPGLINPSDKGESQQNLITADGSASFQNSNNNLGPPELRFPDGTKAVHQQSQHDIRELSETAQHSNSHHNAANEFTPTKGETTTNSSNEGSSYESVGQINNVSGNENNNDDHNNGPGTSNVSNSNFTEFDGYSWSKNIDYFNGNGNGFNNNHYYNGNNGNGNGYNNNHYYNGNNGNGNGNVNYDIVGNINRKYSGADNGVFNARFNGHSNANSNGNFGHRNNNHGSSAFGRYKNFNTIF